ncbi:MAG: hypothetical protein SGPRY_011077 [Prymnesium sp.]
MSLSLLLRLKRGAGGFGIDVAADGTIIQLAKGGQAELDGMLRPKDRVVEVGGELLAGRTLGSLLAGVKPMQVVELTIRRIDADLSSQLRVHSLPVVDATYRMLKLPVRRSPEGMGIELVGSMIRKLAGNALNDMLLKPGDVILSVDGKQVIRNEIKPLLAEQRPVHLLVVVRLCHRTGSSGEIAHTANADSRAVAHSTMPDASGPSPMSSPLALPSELHLTASSAAAALPAAPAREKQADLERGGSAESEETEGTEEIDGEEGTEGDEIEESEAGDESEAEDGETDEGKEGSDFESATTSKEGSDFNYGESAEANGAYSCGVVVKQSSSPHPLENKAKVARRHDEIPQIVAVQIRVLPEIEAGRAAVTSPTGTITNGLTAPSSPPNLNRKPTHLQSKKENTTKSAPMQSAAAKRVKGGVRVPAEVEASHFDPLDESKGTWSDLPGSLDPSVPPAYDATNGLWCDLPLPAAGDKRAGKLSREFLNAMLKQALEMEDDEMLRKLVSVQQFGSSSVYFSQAR